MRRSARAEFTCARRSPIDCYDFRADLIGSFNLVHAGPLDDSERICVHVLARNYAQNRRHWRRFMNERNGSDEIYKHTHTHQTTKNCGGKSGSESVDPHSPTLHALTHSAVRRCSNTFSAPTRPTKIRPICIMIEISRCDRNHCLWARTRARETLASTRWPDTSWAH